MPRLLMERTGTLMATRVKVTNSCSLSKFGAVKGGQVSKGEVSRRMGVMHPEIRFYIKPGTISEE